MKINVNENSRIVEIWLTNAENQDAELREKLKPLYREFSAKKFLVTVFESGERNLAVSTSDLLCYNRKRAAELEIMRKNNAMR